MKKFRKTFIAMFSALAIACIANTIPVYADTGSQAQATTQDPSVWNIKEPELKDTELILVPDDYEPEGPVMVYDAPVQSGNETLSNYELTLLQDMCKTIRTALLNGTTSIDLSDITVTTDTAEQFDHIAYYCPYFDGIHISGAAYYYSNNKYAYLSITNYLSAADTKAWVDKIDTKLNELSALISDSSLSVADQALILHDYMASHYHYDTTYSIYYPGRMLTESTGVCQCYAYLFQYLLNKKGIECYFAESASMNHGWNILKVGSNYYHVDITWDDPTADQYGAAYHN